MKALVREVSSSFERALVRHALPQPLDLARARAQHTAYVATLRALGVEVHTLPALHDHPDACFVEDAAVVADDVALVTRPGHPSRRGEVVSVFEALSRWMPVERMAAGCLDGGDVLVVGRRMYVGLSQRTDAEGIEALRRTFSRYEVVPVELRGGLHLKSGATALPDERVLVAPSRVDPAVFQEPALLVPDEEADACNVVSVGEAVMAPAGFPRTLERLATLGFTVREVDNSELRKADSALTCLSVLF